MLIARNLFRGKLKGFQKGQFCSKITVYNLWSTGKVAVKENYQNQKERKNSGSQKKDTQKQKKEIAERVEFSEMNQIEWFPIDPYCD